MENEQRFRHVREAANQLARESKFTEALLLLQGALSEAQRDGNDRWTLLFAREAGMICESRGDLADATKYLEIALQSNEADPYLHLFLGDVYNRLENQERARECFRRCYELAIAAGDQEILDLLKSRGFAS